MYSNITNYWHLCLGALHQRVYACSCNSLFVWKVNVSYKWKGHMSHAGMEDALMYYNGLEYWTGDYRLMWMAMELIL